MNDMGGQVNNLGEDPPMRITQEAPLGDSTRSETQDLQQHSEISLKKSDKSKRQSKHASMGLDMENSNAKRRSSKLGLFGLFNRSKVSMDVDTPQENLESQWEGIVSTERPLTRDPSAAYVPTEPDLMPIQETDDMPTDAKLHHQSSKGRLRNRHSFRWETKRESKEPLPTPVPVSTWNAPPLFQVYPQSVKHSTLKAPLMSAEAILRLSKEKNVSNESNTISQGERSGSIDGKMQKEKRLRKQTALDIMARGEWVDKTYVLVTAGYLLQYAGQGTYDRLPEKILQLSELSAAFASDAIPGKPFVLQVSQALNEDGSVETEISRSMFKKMGGLRADMRRAVSNLLLVFESPEEMNEWLVAVRKEIEALGGKEYNPEMPWDEPEGKTENMKPPSPGLVSPRYLVMRNSKQFSPKIPSPKSWEAPHDASLGAKILQEERSQEASKSSPPMVSNRQSMVTQNSRKSRYVSDTHESIDQVHLDRLRESYASTAEGTTSTSRDSSPNRSPLLEQDFISEIRAKPLAKATTYPDSVRLSRQRPSETTRTDRESLQPTPTPLSRPTSTDVSSTSGPPSERTMSPERAMSPAPNFSVPSFSKRYSIASASPPLSAKAPSPIPTTVVEGPPITPDDENHINADGLSLTLEQLKPSFKSIPGAFANDSSSRLSTTHLSTPPTSSHSHITPPSSSEGEQHYSRRFSSLDYAKGISPVKTSQHSPSPHPPPNVPLPPLPDSTNSSKRTSLLPPTTTPPNVAVPPLPTTRPLSQLPPAPPPTCPLPPIPTDRRASSRASTSSKSRERSTTPSRSPAPSPASSTSPFPPPTTALPQVPTGPRLTTSNEKRRSHSEKRQSRRDSSRPGTDVPRAAKSQAAERLVSTSTKLPAVFVANFSMENETAFPVPNTMAPAGASGPSPRASTFPHPPSPSSSPVSPPKPTRIAPLPPPSTALSAPTDGSLQALRSTSNAASDTPLQGPMLPYVDTPSRAMSLPIIDAPKPIPSRPVVTTAASQGTSSPTSRDVPQPTGPLPVTNALTEASSFPSPSLTPPFIHTRKSISRVGREPPPVFSGRFFSSKPKTAPVVPPMPVELEGDSAPPPAKIQRPTTTTLHTSTEEKSSPLNVSAITTSSSFKEDKMGEDVKKPIEQSGGGTAASAPFSAPSPISSPPTPLSHPFIPPISLRHSRERGSFDGPWNKEYGQAVAPPRTMLDLGTA